MANDKARSLLESVIDETIDAVRPRANRLELDITANIGAIVAKHSARQIRGLFKPDISHVPAVEGRARVAQELLECAEVGLLLERPPRYAVHSAIFTTLYNPSHPLRHTKLLVLRSRGIIDPIVAPKISVITKDIEATPNTVRSRQLGLQLTQAFGAVLREIVSSGDYQTIEPPAEPEHSSHLSVVSKTKDHSSF